MQGSALDRAAQVLPSLSWLRRVPSRALAEVIRWDLGMGETEVLSFARLNSDYTPVVDDLLAKKCAHSLGIPTIGTGTVLILAKEQRLIASVEQALRHLQEAGLWISESVIEMLKRQAGE